MPIDISGMGAPSSLLLLCGRACDGGLGISTSTATCTGVPSSYGGNSESSGGGGCTAGDGGSAGGRGCCRVNNRRNGFNDAWVCGGNGGSGGSSLVFVSSRAAKGCARETRVLSDIVIRWRLKM